MVLGGPCPTPNTWLTQDLGSVRAPGGGGLLMAKTQWSYSITRAQSKPQRLEVTLHVGSAPNNLVIPGGPAPDCIIRWRSAASR